MMEQELTIPPALIAQIPRRRGATRLLVRTRDGQLTHNRFANIASLLPRGTLLVLNNSKVFPARLKFPHGELLLLGTPQRQDDNLYACEALGRPVRKLPVGTSLQLADNLGLRVVAQQLRGGHVILTLHLLYADNLDTWLAQHACVPLPPYIKREDEQPAHLSVDLHTYQTVYAAVSGSVAAPTRGLTLLAQLLAPASLGGHRDRLSHPTRQCRHVSATTHRPCRRTCPAA